MVEKSYKMTLSIVVLGILLYAGLMNFDSVMHFCGRLFDVTLPVLLALIIAFVLNVPVNGIEGLIKKFFIKGELKPKGKGILRLSSILMTLLGILLVFTLLITLIIPELYRTVRTIIPQIEAHLPGWIAFLKEMNIDTTPLIDWINSIDLQDAIHSAVGKASQMIGSVASVATNTVSWIVQFVIALILSFYILADRENLARQTKKLLYACVTEKAADKICAIAEMVRWNFSKYLSGQCIEAMILGGMILTAFLIFRLPYAILIAATTAVCALIPCIGATISCVIAFILTLLAQPDKAVMCLIVYLIVQFVENQFIYPRVVGGSVGLSPLWTLVAVILGGSTCGILGVIFFIPLIASLYALVSEFTNNRLKKKGLSFDGPAEQSVTDSETVPNGPPASS